MLINVILIVLALFIVFLLWCVRKLVIAGMQAEEDIKDLKEGMKYHRKDIAGLRAELNDPKPKDVL